MAKLTGLQKLQQAAANMAKYGKEAPTAADIARGGPGKPAGYTPTSPTPPPTPPPPPPSSPPPPPRTQTQVAQNYTSPKTPATPTAGDTFQSYFSNERAKGSDPELIKQAWAKNKQDSALPPPPPEQTQTAEAFGDGTVSFKDGLSEPQKQSIQNLLSSGRMFNETDAKNYAYAIGESNWQQFVGKNPGAGALPAPGEEPPPDDTPEDPKTIPGYDELPPEDKSKADELYDKAMEAIEAYGADEYDPEAKRLELIEEEGLDDDFQKINDLDGQIIQLEQGRRDREEDLRAEMKAENATESQIQRELAGQLRPLDRRLRELYDEYNILSKSYNRAMDRINIRMGDIESNLDREARERKDELEFLLAGYGLEVKREEAETETQEVKVRVSTNDRGDVMGINEQTGQTLWTIKGAGKTKTSPVSININQQQGAGIANAGTVFNDPSNLDANGFLKPSVYRDQRDLYATIPGANLNDFDKTYSPRLDPNDPAVQAILPDITPAIAKFDLKANISATNNVFQKGFSDGRKILGKDGKAAPDDFKYLRSIWMGQGGTYDNFMSNFMQYINMDNSEQYD